MAQFRYSIRKLHELTEPSKARGLAVTTGLLFSRLKQNSTAPDRLEYEGEPHREWNSHYAAVKRVRQLMRRKDGPDRIIIRAKRGAEFAIRKYRQQTHVPTPDGAGTDQIDKIHAAVLAFCKPKGWHVTEMGICVNKPGEHGECNAWDGGILGEGGKPLPADEIHRRNLEVAKFLRAEGVKHQNGNGGLPVNGVITLQQYWERGMGPDDWRYYSGTYHAAHWHVSGWPSRTGWV